LPAGDYFVQATNNASLCSTSVSPFTVDDVHIDPTIIASSIIDNSNCSGATPNGSITLSVEVNGVAAPLNEFTIEWFEDAALSVNLGTTIGAVAGVDNEIAQLLSAGTYYVRVTDNTSPNNSCSSTASFSVIDNPPVIGIDQADISVTDQADCAPADGSAQVTDIIVDGVALGSTAGYSFNWLESDGITPVVGAGNADLIAVNLPAGDYFVQATNNASLCSTSVSPFTVDDVHIDPTIIASSIIDNSNCSGATPNGSITLSVEVNGVAAPLNEFTIEWFEDAALSVNLGTTIGAVAGVDNEIAQLLSAGTYYVRVTDNTSPNNSCSSTASFVINDDLPIIGIDQSQISITDQSDCNPINGSASVTNITVDHSVLGNTLGYSFEWFESDGTTPIPGSGNASTVGVVLNAGSYFVRATNTASNCISPVTPFVIDDITVTPTIVAVQNFPNISCDTNYTGQLSASVSEGTTNGVTAGYLFEWFRGANNTNPADFIATGTTISNLQEGDYTVQVTDLATPGNGCLGTASINLKREIPILNATLSVTNQTVCLPVNGSINVVSVQQILMGTTTVFNMSNAADLANFSFQWFDENLNPISAVITGSSVSPNLVGGTYYVQVTNTGGCTTGFTRAVIEDQTTHPDLVLDDFTNPSVCILPEGTGSLSTIADGSINFANYTFTWYEGNNTSGSVVQPNNPILSNIAYTDPQTYTVRVTTNATNCFSDATYTFATDTVEIRAIASAVPLTSCVTPNGSLFSTVQDGAGALYNYEWYSGPTVGTTPVFTTNEVLIAPIGVYTVVAKHPTLNFCTSIPGTAEVTDGRVYPQPVVTLKSPLTYCDPSRPNGVARAEVNGTVTGYTFEWYEGSPAGNLVYTGSEAGSLQATTYYVKAVDVISGCDNTVSILVPNDPVLVPLPVIEVLAEHTDCLNPNGILTASVDGNTQDYSFFWYNGNAIKPQPDVISETYYDLYAGTFSVTATDRVSGCVSPPASQDVKEIFVYPDFDIRTEAANCDEENGRAEIKVKNDVDITSVEWNINGMITYGAILNDLSPGTYEVTATSQLNCSTTKDFIVEPDITVYNGISRNSDGANDIFEIGCINDFPNNSVKIFNRAGTLVYEAKYYDNQETYFNGVSNRGINLLGNELPSGTYFYIIDKGNGSKPRTGYLELMR
ncbi:MAG TPA: gliding motility-associated C-terminal domain-containing protein, partial [Cyclobacteriaceae bacterium]|nr:gliding motility-associated C-terminal domain-containing protein [Cyclobacteriaceae bacterium]